MTEEPTVERALEKLMQMLDKEVAKSVLTFWVSGLPPETASEIDGAAQLHRPTAAEIEASIARAREETELALGAWCEAWSERLHNDDG